MAQPVRRSTRPSDAAPIAEPTRRARAMRAVLAVVVAPIVLGAIVVCVLALTPWGNERVRRLVVAQGNERLTGELGIGSLRGNLFTGATLTDVRLVDSARRPLFTAKRVQVRYALWPALRGRIVVRSLVLDTPVVVLDKRPDSRWNFQSLLRPSGRARDTTSRGTPPELADVTIRHGQMIYRRPWSPDTTLTADRRDSAIAAALGGKSRSLIVRVPGGFQRVLDYHDMDAQIPRVRIAHDGQPTAVEIASLSMLAEPYRPPAIDVRSLAATVYATRDSLWWHGARLTLPGTRAVGDGAIRFRHMGFALELTGAPVAFADLQWLNVKLPESGGGSLRYAMRIRGDTTWLSVADANVRYRGATVRGRVSLTRVHPKHAKSRLFVDGADLTVSGLTTAIVRDLRPSVPFRRGGTFDGHVTVSGPPSDLQLDADLAFDDAAAGRIHVVARGGIAMEPEPRARELAVALRPLRLATLAGTGVRVPLGGVLAGTATVSGGASSGWRVRGDLTHVERGARSHVMGAGSYAPAGRHVAIAARLEPLALATLDRLAPSARLRGSVSGRVRAEGTPRDLRFAGALRSASGSGTLDLRGTGALRGRTPRYDVVAVANAFDARSVSARAPSTSLTGSIAARGEGVRPATGSAELRADLSASRYDTLAVDRLLARVGVGEGVARVDTLRVQARGASASASGTLGLVEDRAGTLRVAAHVDSLGLLRPWIASTDTGIVATPAARRRALLAAARADSVRRADSARIERLALGLPEGVSLALDTLPPLRRDSLAGMLDVDAVLRGSVRRLAAEARISGADLIARGYRADSLGASVSSADVRDRATPLRFEVRASGVEGAGRSFEDVDASGTWRDHEVAGGVRARQDSLVSYAALGAYAQRADGVRIVRLDSLRATFDTLAWRLARPASVTLDHGAVTIDSVELRSSAGGRLLATGRVPEAGPVALDVAAERVRISTLLRALDRDPDAEGVLSLAARLGGTRSAPTVNGHATLREAELRGERAPDVDVTIGYGDRRVTLGATARDSSGRRVLEGHAELPYDLALEHVEGSRRIAGPLLADVTMDSLSLASLPIRSRAVTGVRGRVGADLHVRGSWREPVVTGRAAVRDGGVTVAATGMTRTDATADVVRARDTVRLDSLVARAGGPLRASGYVDLTDRARPVVHATAVGTRLRVMDQHRGLVDANAEVTADGPLDAVRVRGHGEMLHGFLALKQFRKDLLRVKSPGDLTFMSVFDTTGTPGDSARIAMALRQPRTFAIVADLALAIDRGNYYRHRPDANTEFFTGDGEVVLAHIDQRTDDQWAVGFVRIPGGVAYFRTQPFVPVRGSLTLEPHTDAPAIVQDLSERLLWEPGRGWLPLRLFTGGTSKSPAIGLESGTLFPIRGRELNGYLTQGRTSASLLQQSGSSLAGSEAWSGQLAGETGALARRQQGAIALGVVLHDIGTGGTKEYGLDAISVSPADVPTELVFGKTGGVRGALVEAGQYLTVDRYVAGQLRLTRGIPGVRYEERFGPDVRLDVGLEPRFLFRAPEELGITHPTLRTGVFGAFLTRMWDF
jgi:autotransporter translocation and assembly factor TamB